MKLQRSHEPVFWLMFGAGGVVAALALPALVLILALFAPSGWYTDAFSYERIYALSSTGLGRLVWLAIIALPAWHALHRIYHLTHDLKWGYQKLLQWLCYGLAAVATIATMTLLMVV